MRAQLGALILATSIVQLANGFFTTVLSLRLGLESFDPALEGVVMSAYFIGFTIGSVTCGRLLRRIGHIRAYAAFGGIVIAATAILAAVVDLAAWGLMRAAIGYGCAGLFVTTESWLHAKAPSATRGRVFAVYMVGTFIALALGQLLVGALPVEGSLPFQIILALFAVALVMVSTTSAEPPAIAAEGRLAYAELIRAAPLAVLGCFIAGMVSATFYAVFPAWMLANQIPQATISLFMLAAVLGGLAFQLPVGLLSDRFDRRLLLGILATGLAVAALLLNVVPRSYAAILPVAAVLGGFMSTLYPVCISNAMDNISSDRVVLVSSRMILISGIGSACGPVSASWIMGHLDIDGVLYVMAGATLLLAVLAFLRAFTRAEAAHEARPFTVVAPQSIQLAPDAP
ncbi:MFS transporter [Roseomonas aerophila]|uniref:MFS transporter n=1 Tax=Teichococcus aerophilus TaxID=1224513 RepID=A0ABR7RG36_9PROT|nr:MFS transporter [Pseudoroseomonas aerophila]MBC9205361.1 MFS transporter [Pseudoroseomonas aerophila]